MATCDICSREKLRQEHIMAIPQYYGDYQTQELPAYIVCATCRMKFEKVIRIYDDLEKFIKHASFLLKIDVEDW